MLIRLLGIKFITLCALWLIPVGLFLLNPEGRMAGLIVWAITLLSIFVSFNDRRYFALILPFVALLSPLAQNIKIFGLLPSEIFIIILAIAVILTVISRNTYIFALYFGDLILIKILFLVIFAYLFSFEYEALSKSMLSWALMVFVFFSCRIFVSPRDSRLYLVALSASVFLSAILIIFSFFEKINLNDVMFLEFDSAYYSSFSSYYESMSRVSYFYTTIGHLLGVVSIILFTSLLDYNLKKYRIICFSILTITLTALILMQEKTALISMILTVFIALIVFFKRLKKNQILTFTATSLTFALIFFYLLDLNLSSILESINASEFSLGGLEQRICVYASTLNVLFDNLPRFLFYGFGPDSSTLITSNPTIESAKVSCQGSPEGTIDSTYMTLLFEYGLLFILLFFIYLAMIILKAFSQIRLSLSLFDNHFIYFFMVFLFLSISLTTDSIGTSKVMWIFVQLIALVAPILRSSKINS